ncbi:hypothetical protein EYR38_003138 [Pleurotus pulmonarius]|nr:hypothetical protein EYR38_003138 [Pleurotus pulmonarius]
MPLQHEGTKADTETATGQGEIKDQLGAQRRYGHPAFMLSRADISLLGLTATGFFLDAYDYYVINPVATMLQYELFAGDSLPPKLEGLLKSGALIGATIGQLLFGVYNPRFISALESQVKSGVLTGSTLGYLGNKYGRKAIYGKELLTIIIGTVLCLSTPTNVLSPSNSLIYLASFRVIVGIGIGGDSPMSSSITVDRTELWKRGTILAYIMSTNGWGSLVGSLVAITALAAYKHDIHDNGDITKLDAVWRITIGFSLIPALATVYQRLTLPEIPVHPAARRKCVTMPLRNTSAVEGPQGEPDEKAETDVNMPAQDTPDKADMQEFLEYFSEWRHAKHLIGTCLCWFLSNIAFFGVNLNQNFVLQQLGYQGATGTPWQKLFKICTGSLIITVLGFLPGYYFAVLTIHRLGRKWIQIQGALMTALFSCVLFMPIAVPVKF